MFVFCIYVFCTVIVVSFIACHIRGESLLLFHFHLVMTGEFNFGALSLNIRGLRDSSKRKLAFEYLRSRAEQVIFLQETHSSSDVEASWKKNLPGLVYFSNRTSSSGGVLIWIKDNLSVTVEDLIKDSDGRYIFLKICMNGTKFVLVNCYAPFIESEQLPFFEELNQILANFCSDDEYSIVMGGDFNTVFDPMLDKKGGKDKIKEKSVEKIQNIMNGFDLVDIWRIRNPKKQKFTWRQKKPPIQCRLDFWLLSDSLQNSIKVCDMTPLAFTDHSEIFITLKSSDEERRGPSYWTLNTSLLEDSKYIEMIKDKWETWVEEFSLFHEDKRKLWEALKYRIRQNSMKFSKAKAKEARRDLQELEERCKELDELVATHPSDQTFEELDKVKAEIAKHYSRKVKGQIIRSRVQWYEEGEKNSRFFLNLEKRNRNKSTITHLIDHDSRPLTDTKAILNEIRNFYETLYAPNSSRNDDHAESFLHTPSINKLSEEDKLSCENVVTLNECASVLDSFQLNKSPGNDGLPIEFYKVFWSLVGKYVVDSFNDAFKYGELSVSQRQGVIKLIEKKNSDKRFLSNWRPISLINVDTKILSKVLAKRLERILPSIIHHSQSAYVKGRYIGDGIRVIDDLFDYTTYFDLPGLLVTIDFEKAFDSVDWDYMWKVLEAFNFGVSFIRWTKLLYTNISSCVLNNGFSTGYFKLYRGVRQGDPLSPILFIITLETLLCKIRSDEDIKGITIDEHQFKMSAYADDLTSFLNDEVSAANLFHLISNFSKCSGLTVNKRKCEAIWLGRNKDRQDFPLDIRWPPLIKCLGIFFGYDINKRNQLNFHDNIKKLKCLLNIWKPRSLSLLGKITIIKSLAISKLLYVVSNIFTPHSVIRSVNSVLYNYLWNGNDKIKRRVICAGYENGGLKMVSFEAKITAQAIMWVKRLLDGEPCEWKIIARKYFSSFGGPELLFNCNFSSHLMNLGKMSNFYKEIIKSWEEIFFDRQCEQHEEIIWNNQKVLSNGKQIFFRDLYSNGIVFVHHLFDNKRQIFDWETARVKYNLPARAWLQYFGVVSMIPLTWKQFVKPVNPVKTHISVSTIGIEYKSKRWPIYSLQSRIVYWAIVDKRTVESGSIQRIKETYGWDSENIAELFLSPYKATLDCGLRSFHYKLLHHIVYLNDFLFNKLAIGDSPYCSFCKVAKETIQHFFVHCSHTKDFWLSVNRVLKLKALEDPAEEEVIYGFLKEKAGSLENLILLSAKHYLFKCRLRDTFPNAFEYLSYLKTIFSMESEIATKRNKLKAHVQKWGPIYQIVIA